MSVGAGVASDPRFDYSLLIFRWHLDVSIDA